MAVSTRLWTMQSPRPSSEETLLDPEGLLSQERGDHEWGSGILNSRGIIHLLRTTGVFPRSGLKLHSHGGFSVSAVHKVPV